MKWEAARDAQIHTDTTTPKSSLPGQDAVNQKLSSQWEHTAASPAPTRDLCQKGERKL